MAGCTTCGFICQIIRRICGFKELCNPPSGGLMPFPELTGGTALHALTPGYPYFTRHAAGNHQQIGLVCFVLSDSNSSEGHVERDPQAVAVYFIRHVEIVETPHIVESQAFENVVYACRYLHIWTVIHRGCSC